MRTVYYVTEASPRFKQLSFEDFLFGEDVECDDGVVTWNASNTRTVVCSPEKIKMDQAYISGLIKTLREFNNEWADLKKVPRKSLYSEFMIPKKSGGLRKIDAPNEELMTALRELKKIFEVRFHALYHTSAFAYIKNRSTIDAVKKHQQNESKWFGKFDLSNFFGSTTPEFVISMFEKIYPFSEVLRSEKGREEFISAIDLAFLDGGLPQGTPISPTITNIMMIPVDFELSNTLRNYQTSQDKHQRFVYTRYADDFLISSRYNFNFKQIENLIKQVLERYNAPFTIKESKTRYGSSAGSNWNLGVMLNKDNEITVGYRKKRQFKAMLTSYVMDRKNGVKWPSSDLQALDGYRSYYTMVEGKNIDDIISHLSQKFNFDIRKELANDLRPYNNNKIGL